MIEGLVLEPVQGEFDVAAIAEYLDSQPTTARDPQEPRRFLLSANPKWLDEAVAKRRAGEQSISHSVIVVFPVASCVDIGMRTTDTEPARLFVEWLRARQPIRILDDDGNDHTDRCRDNLDFLFT